jgi:CRISPR system Cascade subunit CasD
MWDYQTADLGQLSGFGRWGPTKPGGGSKDGTHILNKEYLADAHFTVALGLDPEFRDVSVNEIAAAFRRPARPLFLGRKSCPPAAPLLRGEVEASSPLDALSQIAVDRGMEAGSKRIWFSEDQSGPLPADRTEELWQRRDYRTSRFDAMERFVERRVMVAAGEE